MQNSKAFDALTSLLPSSENLLKLARKCRFVLRRPRKIWPEDILRAVLCAVGDCTPWFRAIAAKLGEITEEGPSRQAVFERLEHEAAPDFFWEMKRCAMAHLRRLQKLPDLVRSFFKKPSTCYAAM